MEKILYNESGPDGKPYKKGDWKEFAVHTEDMIKGFFGEYRFLSNFWPARVFLDDAEYPSVESAYQAAKWKAPHRKFFLSCTDLESIDYNRSRAPDGYSAEEWNGKKLEVMKDLIRQKFDPRMNPENRAKLEETKDKHLEEMNWWGDLYWGTDLEGRGENMLGKLLMEIRGTDGFH